MVLYSIAEGVEVGLCVDPLFSVTPPGKAPRAVFKVTLAPFGGHVCCFHVLAIVNIPRSRVVGSSGLLLNCLSDALGPL